MSKPSEPWRSMSVRSAMKSPSVVTIQRSPSLPASRNRAEHCPGPKLPPLPRGSSSGSTSGPSNPNTGVRFSITDAEAGHEESATSSSAYHGVILVIIMLSTFIAFLSSKINDPCNETEFKISKLASEGKVCSGLASALFSISNILLCVFCFVTYFLHLIGQCDYVLSTAWRRLVTEVAGIVAMMALVAWSLVYALATTALVETNLVAVILCTVGLVFCLVRSSLLMAELFKLFRSKKLCHATGNGESLSDASKMVALKSVVSKSASNASGQKSALTRTRTTSSSGSVKKQSTGVTFVKTSNSSNSKNKNQLFEFNDSDDDVFVDITI
ncbi:hypothetical protein HDE_11936 [Halotydeus destructor]|nr:hypothetical protein HDE_11936 [Halotydeus destructor]